LGENEGIRGGKNGEGAQKSEGICSKWTKITRMNKKLVKSYKYKEKQGRKLGGCVVECVHLWAWQDA
jgi:hypothetical protein